MTHKKVLALLLTAALVASTAVTGTGCGSAQSSSEAETSTEDQESSGTSESTEESSSEATEDSSSGESGTETQETQTDKSPVQADSARIEELLGEIATLNSCQVSDLNVAYDDGGYVSYLGCAYSDEKVTDVQSAFDSLSAIAELAGMEGIYMEESRVDTSPVSNDTYYSFVESGSLTLDGETYPVDYSDNVIKVIADADGNLKGYSAYIDREGSSDYTEEDMVSMEEAEKYVEEQGKGVFTIYPEYSNVTYWQDGVLRNTTRGDRVLAWVIYTDYPLNDQPYSAVLVNLLKKDKDNRTSEDDICQVVSEVGVPELGYLEDMPVDYVSELFFQNLEDAGKYTYQLDMTWAEEANSGYQAAHTLEVTVPVARNSEDGLYYLADVNTRLAVFNYADMTTNDLNNPLVSEDPEDASSWHFKYASDFTGETTYFCDPNYILSNYWCLWQVRSDFNDRYNENFRTLSEMPAALYVYSYLQGEDYPTEVSGFEKNASSMGQIDDWNGFVTSPACSMGMEYGTMAHEYTHGLNKQLTPSQYLNGAGAVMEGFADSVGETFAMVQGYKDEEYNWVVGSQWSEIMRSMKEPETYEDARYIGGNYYVFPVDESLSAVSDSGGVHCNSGTVNYLTYSLCNSEDPDAAVITPSQAVDLWMEVMYNSLYSTSYNQVGAMLEFAAAAMGLTEDQIAYVCKTVESLGFKGANDTYAQLIDSEPGVSYTVNIQFEQEEVSSQIDILGELTPEGGKEHDMGGLNSKNALYATLPGDSGASTCQLLMEIGLKSVGKVIGVIDLGKIDGNATADVPFSYKECLVGDTIDFGNKTIADNSVYSYEEQSLVRGTDGSAVFYDLQGESSAALNSAGLYTFVLQGEDGNGFSIVLIEASEAEASTGEIGETLDDAA